MTARKFRAKGTLSAAEWPTEELARTVVCPNCGAPVGAPCPYRVSHLGRLIAARCGQKET